ncbi:MAG: glycosyltransferase family 4 protein [Desulfovibrionales bacterium]|nr:glycosyltransferase family 4 protein [Desulfovibrionales bacterium]
MKEPSGLIWGTLDPFVERGPVLGRKVANRGFIQALLTVDPFDGYHFFLPDALSGQAVHDFVQQYHPGLGPKIRILPRTELPSRIASTAYHCFHLSDCMTTQGFLAALRNRVSCTAFPVTGVTHSLSYARYGQAIAQHVWSGVTRRDCIVATSRAGASVVRNMLQGLLERMPDATVPQVELVPLGVWRDEFVREGHAPLAGVPDAKTVFLVPGRISPYSKMDILPLLRAFQRLGRAGTDLGGICLVLAGGADEGTELPGTLASLGANIGLEIVVVRCPDDEVKKALLHRADVVVSLADNPQETFGLTLLEAGAAGKPVIASDYDGYRDLVLHGQTGLLVPTMDSGMDETVGLMAPLLYDSVYHLWLAQDVAVDVAILAGYLARLIDPGERERMGAAAREHARKFDWPKIVKQYLALWERLHEEPCPLPGQGAFWHPLALDYGRVFSVYASGRLHESHVLEATDLGRAVYRGQDHPVMYAGIEDRIDLDLMRFILVRARRGIAWGRLAEECSSPALGSTVLWMLKNDLLNILHRDET